MDSGGDQVTRTEPWVGVRPFMIDIYNRGRQLHDRRGSLNPILTDQAGNPQTPRGRREAFAESFGLDSPRHIRQQLIDMGVSPDVALGVNQGLRTGGIVPFMPTELQAHQDIIDLAETGRSRLSPFAMRTQRRLQERQGARPEMYERAQALAEQAAQTPWFDEAAGIVRGSLDSPYYGEAAAMFRNAANNPLFDEAAAAARRAGDLSVLREAADAIRGQLNPGLGPAEDATRQTVEGGYLTPESNPYLERWYEAAMRPVQEQFMTSTLPGITGQFAEAGRYGGGAHQYGVAQAGEDFDRQLADSASQFYGRAYQQERDLQEAATSRLAQMGQFRDQLALNAALGLGDVGQAIGSLGNQNASVLGNIGSQQAGARQGAASGLLNVGQAQQAGMQRGAGLLGDLGAARSNIQLGASGRIAGIEDMIQNQQLQALMAAVPFEQLKLQTGAQRMNMLQNVLGVGGAQREMGQALLGIPSQQAMEPWQRLDLYNSIISGSPGATMGNTIQEMYGNPIAGGLGGAATGAGLGGLVGGPPGALIGGGLGGLLGIL